MKSLIALLPVLALAKVAHAGACPEGRDFYRNLPVAIGREDQVGKFPYAMPCDTMYVRKGVTTVVYPGGMLYFERPSLASVIKVEGTLILKGTKNSYVTLSGSIDSGRTGPEPGNRQWGGIEVAEGGRLEMEYAGCMRAPTPITTFSSQVRIVNSWFKGSSGLILPDGSLYPMESSWQAINNLDLSKGYSDKKPEARPAEALSEKEKAALLEEKPGFWTWKKAGIGLAALAVVGAGAAVLLPHGGDKGSPSDNPPPKEKVDISGSALIENGPPAP
jgi:hypothetical protein